MTLTHGAESWIREVTNAADFEAAYAVRRRVFVDEQKVPLEEELDALDATSRHVIVGVGDRVIATGRLIGPHDGVWHLGRIAVDAPWRGRGIGRLVMAALEGWAVDADAEAGRDQTVLELSAQVQAAGFYEHLGYVIGGPVYLDAGIEHQDARKVVRRAPARPVGGLD